MTSTLHSKNGGLHEVLESAVGDFAFLTTLQKNWADKICQISIFKERAMLQKSSQHKKLIQKVMGSL